MTNGIGRVWPSSSPILWLCICLAAILCPVAQAGAEKRVALVIGNGAYKETTALANTRNDATDMIAVLKRLDFDVLDGLDLDKRGMERLIRQFEQKLAGADMALFFYAGHVIQVSGQNHLVPVDARLAAEGDIDFESLPISLVLSRMERTVKTSLVLLDACRDNPLARNLARTMGTRAANVGQGLAEVKTGIGTLISFSTQPGNVALDGKGRNSPYTTALLKEIETPGRDVLATLAAVRGAVVKATDGRQVPWEHTSLLGSVVLKAPEAAVASGPPPSSPPPSTSYAAESWPLVKDSSNIAELEAYVRRFGDTFHGDLARQRLETLKRQQAALAKAEASKAAEPAPQPKAAPAPKPQQLAAATPPAPTPKREACDTVRTLENDGRESCLVAGRGDAFKDCPECPDLVVVPAGNFMMGSPASEPDREPWQKGTESPQRRVTIGKPFAVARYATTFAEWDACVAAGGCGGYKPADQGWGRGKRPVINVHWDHAKAYVAWLSKKSGQPYRLLTEAEREYVARAGTTTPFWWGSSITPGQANYNGSADPYKGGGAKGEYRQKTMPVDSFEPNPWGLYQVHGNVWEWTEDCWHDTYQGAPADGSAWITACTDAGRRVVRGGSWLYIPLNLRSAYRLWYTTGNRNYNLGFRVARTLNP